MTSPNEGDRPLTPFALRPPRAPHVVSGRSPDTTSGRLWFKIGETAQIIGVAPKELRYWEKVIPELRPRRSKGNLRYYHVDEFPRLERIRAWLEQGFTVADCRELMLHGQIARPLDLGLEEAPPPAPKGKTALRPNPSRDRDLAPVLKALQALVKRLSRPLPSSHLPEPPLDPNPDPT